MRCFLLACLALCLAASPAAAWTVAANPEGLTGDQHIDYPAFGGAPDRSAPQMTAANVGDVNGDGREDIAAAFAYAEPGGRTPLYVTFTSAHASTGDVRSQPGFKIVTSQFLYGLSAAGDVNGDGRGDVAVARADRVAVVFGRTDGATVDLDALADDGFTISGAGANGGSGYNGVMLSGGVAPLGDLDGDGVPELLVTGYSTAMVVYPSRDAAGSTIYAGAPGPQVAMIRIDEANRIDARLVDTLGDIDGDGRSDILLAGEEAVGTGQVAYGVSAPARGATLTLPAAVADGKAFAIRTHDGRDGWYGELEQVLALGDQNGDGVRDVGMVCGGCGTGGRQLRVVYTPSFGTTVDASDLYASDPRGWSFHSYSAIVDAGDQNGDGVGDVVTSSYVYFPDPRHEPGSNEAVHSGFYFSDGVEVVASLADVNGDGRRELVVADVDTTDLNGTDASGGQSATYAIDIYDSATPPDISLPAVPVPGTGGALDVGVTIDPGAGSRGDSSLLMQPALEIATPTGAPEVAASLRSVQGRQALSLPVQPSRALGGLVAGRSYRVRATASNNRGQQAAGPWRSFTYSPRAATGATPAARTLRLAIAGTRVVLRDGRLGVRVTCGAGLGRCRGTLSLKTGRLRLGSRSFSIADGRRATVRVALTKAARRALRTRRSIRVVATAKAKSAAGVSAVATSRFSARLRG